jgi:hypothetical protein
MRYGVIAENKLEEQMLSSPKAPRALFDTFLPLVQARAIIAGVRLRVFEALRDGDHSCEELGQSLVLDVEALELVPPDARWLRLSGSRGRPLRPHGSRAADAASRRGIQGDSSSGVAAGMMAVWVAANRLHTDEWSTPHCNGFADEESQSRG